MLLARIRHPESDYEGIRIVNIVEWLGVTLVISSYWLFCFPIQDFRFRLEGQSSFAYWEGRKEMLSLCDFSYTLFGFRLSPSKMFLQPCVGKLKT